MSNIQDTCFKDYVGLSQNTCDCFGVPPEGYNTSLSKLYIDQTEGLDLRFGGDLDNCKDGSLWDILWQAREDAVKAVKADLVLGIAAANKQRRPIYAGVLGEFEQKSGYQAYSEVMVGRRWIMNPIRGGFALVRGLWVKGDQTTTVNMALYSQLSDTPVAVINLTTQANTWKWNAFTTPIVLPCYSPEVGYLNYFWVYAPLSAPVPFNVFRNEVHCGCGGKSPFWSCDTMLFPDYPEFRWNSFLMDAGVRGDVLADRMNWGSTISEAYGLRFDVQLYCNVEQTICSDAITFGASELPMQTSYLLQFKSAYFVASKILSLTDPGRGTMCNREQMERNRQFYFSEYNGRLGAVIAQYSTEQNLRLLSDCYICRDEIGFRKTGILA